MPTGYTADIEKGITFQQFALNCARAFGACVTMRDDSSDTPIPEQFIPSDWHSKELRKAKARLTKLNRMTRTDAETASRKAYKEEDRRISQALQENQELMQKYYDMLSCVKQWQPPTQGHVEFKNFMAQQIESSIQFDGMKEYYSSHPAVLLEPEEWLEQERSKARSDIEYHTKENEAEIERVNGHNTWIRALRQSLNAS